VPTAPNFGLRVKVKLSRYTPWRRFGGEEVLLLLILNLGTRWGWVVSITPRPCFTPGTHWTGGWVGPRGWVDAEARRKILCLCRGSNPGRPVRSQTLYCLNYSGSSGFEYFWKFNVIVDRRSTGVQFTCLPIVTIYNEPFGRKYAQ
jgi:hypothetical protein